MESTINLDVLKERFPQLKYNREKKEFIGNIHIECICKDEFIKDDFEIRIELLKDDLPKVWEISNKVKNSYRHLYEDKRLCLATDLEQRLYLEKHTIIEWIKEYVETYFISYIYYKKYGVFPFGEHSHGEIGTYEFIKKHYKMDNLNEAKSIYLYVCTQKYRGHLDCPCGSGKKLRNCHGNIILEILNGDEIKVLKDNYRRMEHVGRNKQKTK